jgi:hypothetical protein
MTRKFAFCRDGVERCSTPTKELKAKELCGGPGLGNFFVWRGKYVV